MIRKSFEISDGRYIERNPVRAGIAAEAQDYPYSSAGFYCLGKDDDLTSEDPTFVDFGLDIANRRLRYREFLDSFDSEEERSFKNLERPQGNREFVKRLAREHGRLLPKRRGRISKGIVA